MLFTDFCCLEIKTKFDHSKAGYQMSRCFPLVSGNSIFKRKTNQSLSTNCNECYHDSTIALVLYIMKQCIFRCFIFLFVEEKVVTASGVPNGTRFSNKEFRFRRPMIANVTFSFLNGKKITETLFGYRPMASKQDWR